MDFKVHDVVTVELEDDVMVRGLIIRITETEHGKFYGVKLKKCQIHGLDPKFLRLETPAGK